MKDDKKYCEHGHEIISRSEESEAKRSQEDKLYSQLLGSPNDMARYKKIIGYGTLFVTGMDGHGQKIETIAKKENISCQELVDKNSLIFEKL